jgi:polyisoprenoid-binding protein YceI
MRPAFIRAAGGPTIVPMTSTSTNDAAATTNDTPPIAPLALAPGRWAVDHAHSELGFTIRHLGISKVRGRFARFDGDVVVGDTEATTSVTATVELASVDTGNADRDDHVRSPDLLDVERRPAMTFRSTGVRPNGKGDADGRWHLDGELTIGDVTRPLTLTVEHGGVEDHPMGGPRHAGFEASGEIRRSDYGIAPQFPAAVLGDVVRIELDLQLLEP